MKTICLEEHFVIPEVVQAWQTLDPRTRDIAIKASTEGEGGCRLLEIGPERLAAMDAAGIDTAVLSLTTPGVQNLATYLGVEVSRFSNDRLADAVRRYPNRLQGFASLPILARRRTSHVNDNDMLQEQIGRLGRRERGREQERESENAGHEECWTPQYGDFVSGW